MYIKLYLYILIPLSCDLVWNDNNLKQKVYMLDCFRLHLREQLLHAFDETVY